MAKTKEFKAEIRQMLDLMIHSLYSNRDIFLRELIANAADAIDKARFESLTDPEKSREWRIRLAIDSQAKTLTVSDNGIGMNEEEVVANIGTIAKSGTKAFLQMLEENKDNKAALPELIGQFGVGFYSAFMAADEVELVTKKFGDDPAVKWASRGEGKYTIDSAECSEPGTTITLKLKEDADIYLQEWKISEIIHRYSDFIEYPIILPVKKVNEDKSETVEDKVLNSQKAIWLRKPSEVTEEEYQSFYGHVAHSAGEYFKSIHISAEGTSEFKALLFLPKEAPFNILMPEIQKRGLQLYVKRVFITDECQELIPEYLRFVKGVVDSSDLPLNVSREILQDNGQIRKIERAITGRMLTEFKKLLENDREGYEKFFAEFGKVFKEGIHSDFTNAEKLKDLVLYQSMNTPAEKMITLGEYVDAMPENQKAIYYITGEKRESVASSPALEYFRKQGFDVLFMTDPIDDWIMQEMFQYRKKDFKSVAKGDFEVDGTEENLKAAAEKYQVLVDALKKSLEGKVAEVKFSARLTDSPCCLVTDGNSLSPHLERLFKAMHQDVPQSRRILELNPAHPLLDGMLEMSRKAPDSPEFAGYAKLLYDQALLVEGSPVDDAAAFAREITALMQKSLKN